jgi:hypothetical protein
VSASATPLLVEPAYKTFPDYTETLGPEVADLCAMAGFAPDEEQRLGLDLIFALDAKGKSACFEFCVVCSRQNLKTGLFKQAALGWLFVAEERLIVWSAHEFSTTKEALRDLAALIEGNRWMERRVKTIRYANDDPSIELTTGQRVKFKARTRSGGRGLTGDKVILDEAFALTPDHMGSLLPTLSVRPDPQLLYGSSAGLVHSDVLRGIRDRGRKASSSRLAYLEWCAARGGCDDDGCRHEVGAEGCALDDEANWQAANPLLGRTRENGTGLTAEYVRAEREALPPHEFARERLGWWDEAGADEAFGPGNWDDCRGDRPDGMKVGALAVAVSYDLSKACVGAAGKDDDVIHGRPLQHGPGTGWVVARAKQLQDLHDVEVVIDGKGPAADLIDDLENAGVRLRVVDTGEVLDSCAEIYKAVQDRRFRHGDYPELDAAAAAAVPRTVGDRWAWGRKQSDADISPLEAITLAAWGVTHAAELPAPEIF